jgi:hypothetical protein
MTTLHSSNTVLLPVEEIQSKIKPLPPVASSPIAKALLSHFSRYKDVFTSNSIPKKEVA